MKKIILVSAFACLTIQPTFAQNRISKRELDIITKNQKASPLLVDDPDFTSTTASGSNNDGAVILSQKTTFAFDKKGISAGKIIGRNILGIIFAPFTLGTSILAANRSNGETQMLVEETERRRLLLNDKFSIEQYSILYFRLSNELDAFSAKVIKKDGSQKNVELADAVRVENSNSVPDIFRSYTDQKISTTYRPSFYKIAVPDLEEGDVIEYEFRNINNRSYGSNPNYKEFTPVYYVCNRSMPVAKQIIEITTADEHYHLSYKTIKGAPNFTLTSKNGSQVYRWVDEGRDKLQSVKYVSTYTELPMMKFQVSYTKNTNNDLVWFKNDEELKKDMTPEELMEKAKTAWFQPGKVQGSALNASSAVDIGDIESTILKALKKRGIKEAADDDYVRKAYYTIRSRTLYNSWNDYTYARIFSDLLTEKKIDHEVIVTNNNHLTDLSKVTFTSELGWLIKYKDKFYCNPSEHLNPEELSSEFNGNVAARFNPDDKKGKFTIDRLPVTDTLTNTLTVQLNSSLPDITQPVVTVDRTTEAKGSLKDVLIDDALALTPFMESDFKNYDGAGLWEGLSSREEDKASEELTHQKKEWKEDKPLMMKEIANGQYNEHVYKYNSFRIMEDGRSYKKRTLKYIENFTLTEMTSNARDDIVLKLPSLIGSQTRIKKEDKTRSYPVNIKSASAITYYINFTVPAGYTLKGWEGLNKKTENDFASFTSRAKLENNVLYIQAREVFKKTNVEAANWPSIVVVLDAAYNFSQAKLLLKKG